MSGTLFWTAIAFGVAVERIDGNLSALASVTNEIFGYSITEA